MMPAMLITERVGHIALRVPHLGAAVSFHSEVLGLVETDAHKAERRADQAEEEARYAIAFAYSAVVEAVLDAALARMEADDLSKEKTTAA
jgi:catechol 2,3-dioxygenase-like lactoylglutathione lyase family enzyme